MIKSAVKGESLQHILSQPVIKMPRSLAVFGCAMIAVCSSVTFAQDPTVITIRPGEATATRQRKTIAGPPQSTTSAARIDRPAIKERRVFVRSTSLLVRGAVVEDKLLKRPEFKQSGFVITRDGSEADLILELRHDLFTMYVFSVVDNKTGSVLASGKLSSLGGTVAGKVAKRFLNEMSHLP